MLARRQYEFNEHRKYLQIDYIIRKVIGVWLGVLYVLIALITDHLFLDARKWTSTSAIIKISPHVKPDTDYPDQTKRRVEFCQLIKIILRVEPDTDHLCLGTRKWTSISSIIKISPHVEHDTDYPDQTKRHAEFFELIKPHRA